MRARRNAIALGSTTVETLQPTRKKDRRNKIKTTTQRETPTTKNATHPVSWMALIASSRRARTKAIKKNQENNHRAKAVLAANQVPQSVYKTWKMVDGSSLLELATSPLTSNGKSFFEKARSELPEKCSELLFAAIRARTISLPHDPYLYSSTRLVVVSFCASVGGTAR